MDPAQTLPAPTEEKKALVYETFDGQTVELTTQLFIRMLCPEANREQAYYMLQWCAHNRIDPFALEAYFQILDGKPVIQVSKDAWFRRMERNPRFVSQDSGILVETSMEKLKAAVLAGRDDYLISGALRERFLADFAEGKSTDPKGAPSRLEVKKRGQYVAAGEELLAGWAEIAVRDRPFPYRFQVDVAGWAMKKRGTNEENIFWRTKPAFMVWKTALKNCVRLAFPELSGLLALPEQEFDPAAAADYELAEAHRKGLLRALFAAGREIPPPDGPWAYPQLHSLCGRLYDGKGLSEVEVSTLEVLVQQLRDATGNAELRQELATALQEAEANRVPDLRLRRARTYDEVTER